MRGFILALAAVAALVGVAGSAAACDVQAFSTGCQQVYAAPQQQFLMQPQAFYAAPPVQQFVAPPQAFYAPAPVQRVIVPQRVHVQQQAVAVVKPARVGRLRSGRSVSVQRTVVRGNAAVLAPAAIVAPY